MQCQAALQVRVHSTTVVRFRYPHRSGLAELFVLCEGTILADDDVKTARYQYDLLGRGSVYWAIIIYLFPFVSSRVSFSARLLFDVAASQVPSVAAAVVFLCEERNFFSFGRQWSRLVFQRHNWAQSEQSCCRRRRGDDSSSQSAPGGVQFHRGP